MGEQLTDRDALLRRHEAWESAKTPEHEGPITCLDYKNEQQRRAYLAKLARRGAPERAAIDRERWAMFAWGVAIGCLGLLVAQAVIW